MDRAELEEHNRKVIDEFRRRGGIVGGMYDGMTLLLVHTAGAKTGRRRTNPVVCQALDNGSYAIFAANGGAAVNPDWYHNLLHEPRVTIEVDGTEIAVTARITDGDERDRIWARQTQQVPHFAELAAAADREIPVVVFDPRRPE
jgi:deazaflavin-dependent oxidoreductase (nitroreductase family)